MTLISCSLNCDFHSTFFKSVMSINQEVAFNKSTNYPYYGYKMKTNRNIAAMLVNIVQRVYPLVQSTPECHKSGCDIAERS